MGLERRPGDKSGVAVAAVAAGGPLRGGGQGDGRVGEECGVGAGVDDRQGEGADQGGSGGHDL